MLNPQMIDEFGFRSHIAHDFDLLIEIAFSRLTCGICGKLTKCGVNRIHPKHRPEPLPRMGEVSDGPARSKRLFLLQCGSMPAACKRHEKRCVFIAVARALSMIGGHLHRWLTFFHDQRQLIDLFLGGLQPVGVPTSSVVFNDPKVIHG